MLKQGCGGFGQIEFDGSEGSWTSQSLQSPVKVIQDRTLCVADSIARGHLHSHILRRFVEMTRPRRLSVAGVSASILLPPPRGGLRLSMSLEVFPRPSPSQSRLYLSSPPPLPPLPGGSQRRPPPPNTTCAYAFTTFDG